MVDFCVFADRVPEDNMENPDAWIINAYILAVPTLFFSL